MPAACKLWVVTYNFRPLWAGPAERFMRYAAGLRARGVDTTFVTVMRAGQPREEHEDNTHVLRLGPDQAEAESMERFHARAALAALRAPDKPDTVLFLGINPLHAPLLWAMRWAGIGTLYVSTMAVSLERPSALKQWLLTRALRVVHRAFSRNVSSTTALLDNLAEIGIPPAQCTVISNGVKLSRFRPPTGAAEIAAVRDKLGLPHGEVIVLFVGLMIERKGIFELVEAWRRHRARGGAGRLVMLGDEAPDKELAEATERWRRLRATFTPEDQIEVRPASREVEQYFRASDVFVFMSRLEGMPNVIPEAMASGLPVLTTRFEGFSEDLGRPGSDLEVTSREIDAVAAAIGRLVGDPALRQRMGQSGRAWVETHHDVEKSLDRYAAICREVSAEAQGARWLGRRARTA